MGRKPAPIEEPRKRPTIADLPPLLTLPQIAAYLGRSRWWAAKRVDEDRAVLAVGGKELPLWKENEQWRCWRADLADVFEEKEAG